MSDEKKTKLKAVDTKTVPARPDEMIHVCTELLHRIVQKRDKAGLEAWIIRYIRSVAVAYPIGPPVGPAALQQAPGMTAEKQAQLRVVGNMAMAISPAAVWSEKVDVQKAQKFAHAEMYFLDVLGVMGKPE